MELTEHEMTLAKKIAKNIGKKWRLDTEDLEQHLILWLLENYKSVERWRKETGDGKLYVSLRREAGKYCAKETGQQLGEPIDKNNAYNVETVKKVLPFIWEITSQTAGKMMGENPMAIAVLADVSGAYHGMPKEDQKILAYRFLEGKSYEDLGLMYDITADAARMRINRALQRLTSKLSGVSGVWDIDNLSVRFQAE